MNFKSKYAEKLRDPRWQKKRLEIMQRDEFTCQACDSKEKTLNVHHCYYKKGADPWDYENESLVTLCEECHESEKVGRESAESDLLLILRQFGFLTDDLNNISNGVINREDRNPRALSLLMSMICERQYVFDGALKAFNEYNAMPDAWLAEREKDEPNG